MMAQKIVNYVFRAVLHVQALHKVAYHVILLITEV